MNGWAPACKKTTEAYDNKYTQRETSDQGMICDLPLEAQINMRSIYGRDPYDLGS